MSTTWDRKVAIAAKHGFELRTFYWASQAHDIGVHISSLGEYFLSDGVSKILTDEEKERTYRRFDHALRDANRIGQRGTREGLTMAKFLTTHDELFGFLVDHYHDPDEYRQLLGRVDHRGDGLAIYRNTDLGSAGLGQIMVGSYGSPEALFEVELHTELPATMPDGVTNPEGGTVNWRYTLVAVYLKEAERS